ncbi:MAG: phosphate/phosphite/phosphonate ABC transporter substrate-binding protein [Gammaproteobacteria bacterium]|nr:phosphate/phosphite/phosphonate ABC transporter substrate-binding protein [Gammaproteobacteria bacterium]
MNDRSLLFPHTALGFRGLLAALLLAVSTVASVSAELTLVVQGERFSDARNLSAVPGFLSEALGQPVRLELRQNPLEHWRHLAAGERPAMVLEDPHFADYRVTRSGYRIVAAVEGRQVFTLAAGGFFLLDPMDLAGQPVAALSPPSLSTLQLLAFFPDAVHMPRIIESPSYRVAAARVYANEAVVAVLPADNLGIYSGLKGMLLMEELPGKAFCVSPDVAEAVADRITAALLGAAGRPDGRRALTQLEIAGFVRGHREAYDGLSRLLKGSWGFRQIRP